MSFKKSAGNVTVSYNSNALAAYLDQASIDAVVNAIETTNLASTGVQNIAGLPSWSVKIGGPWDLTLDGYLGPDAITPPTTLRTLTVGIDTITYTWTANAFISAYSISADGPNGRISWSGTLTTSGVPGRA